jgi:hypothetical protein
LGCLVNLLVVPTCTISARALSHSLRILLLSSFEPDEVSMRTTGGTSGSFDLLTYNLGGLSLVAFAGILPGKTEETTQLPLMESTANAR